MSLGNRFSQHSFASVPQANIARSKFDRSFGAKDTLDFDFLNPIFVDEILPGDTINLTVNHFIRLATQVVPVLDNIRLDFYFFFVPNRLVWDNWEKFNGAQDNPTDSTDYLIPQLEVPQGASAGFTNGSIFDKYGLPTGVGPSPNPAEDSVNALILRGYNLIVNDWYRDQNLNASLVVPKGDGPDNETQYELFRSAKPHDYFTSALPWPQKGDAVTLSIGSSAPVVSDGTVPNFSGGGLTNSNLAATNSGAVQRLTLSGTIGSITTATFGNNTGLEADLTEATAVTINQFRLAIMTQSLLELDARGGTRYVEILKAHFNVISPDFRLQRPEFLSSASVLMNQHPVAQTSETGTTPQANLAAYTTSSSTDSRVGFTKSFVEHGYVHGFMRARGDVTYQGGLHKMWSRQTRMDFFWPKLQELGEQAILNKELYYSSNVTLNNQVFGYAERFAEYRFYPSQIRGQFRSNFAESLDVWHLAQDFPDTPLLNSNFIQGDTPIERVLATEAGYPHLLCDFWFNYKHARPMVTYGIPASLGRF